MDGNTEIAWDNTVGIDEDGNIINPQWHMILFCPDKTFTAKIGFYTQQLHSGWFYGGTAWIDVLYAEPIQDDLVYDGELGPYPKHAAHLYSAYLESGKTYKIRWGDEDASPTLINLYIIKKSDCYGTNWGDGLISYDLLSYYYGGEIDGTYFFTPSASDTYFFIVENREGESSYFYFYVSVVPDTTPPSISFSPSSRNWDDSSVSVTISISDDSELGEYRYAWSHSTSKPSSGWSSWNDISGQSYSTTKTKSGEGEWYLHVEAKDAAGNLAYEYAGPYKIDTTPPGDWKNFNPSDGTNDLTPLCSVDVKDTLSGLDVASAYYDYSKDGGVTWSGWLPCSCSGSDGSKDYETIWITDVPFNQISETRNKIKFKISDVAGNTAYSPVYTVKINPSKPSISTLDSTNVGTHSARLNGKIDNDGGEACQIRFRYREVGTTTWHYVPSSWSGSYHTGDTFYYDLSGLNDDTTYEYQVGAKNSAGESWGSTKQFTTQKEIQISDILFDPSHAEISQNQNITLNILLTNLTNGLSGYNITVTIENTTVAEIVDVEFPSWAILHSNATLPSDSIWIKAVDLNNNVKGSLENVLLARIDVQAMREGSTRILIGLNRVDDDNGNNISANIQSAIINVTAILPLPSCNPPKDLDNDGKYEDINGNGRLDFDDVVKFFHYFEWIQNNWPIEVVDFNGNGRLDFHDVVCLFDQL